MSLSKEPRSERRETASSALAAGGAGQLVLYRTEDGQNRISCRLEEDSVWLTQAAIADLFQTTPQNITLHIGAIYQEGELREDSTCKEYLQVRQGGSRQVSRRLKHYNLNVVLAVGYRVRSPRGTEFRQWATAQLSRFAKNYLTHEEIDTLNLIVSAYLDFAELQARNRKPMTMREWIAKLDSFLKLSDRDLLTHAGTVSHDAALAKAQSEYDKFRAIEDAKPRPVDADFEKAIEQTKKIAAANPKHKSKKGKE